MIIDVFNTYVSRFYILTFIYLDFFDFLNELFSLLNSIFVFLCFERIVSILTI